VRHTMVLILHRHVLLKAMCDFPAAAPSILVNETWRGGTPRFHNLELFEGVPPAIMSRLEASAAPLYFRPESQVLGPGEHPQSDGLLFLVRGEVRVLVFGIQVRTLYPGDYINLFGFLDLPLPSSPCQYVAITACDMFCIPRKPMLEALADERFEDDLLKFSLARQTLNGDELKDAFGFSITGRGREFITDCVERSDIFRACSKGFVSQIPGLVEEEAFWPGTRVFKQGEMGSKIYFVQAGRLQSVVMGLEAEAEMLEPGSTFGDMHVLGMVPAHGSTVTAESHVWCRVLDKKVLDRALSAFPGDERRLTGAGGRGNVGLFDDD